MRLCKQIALAAALLNATAAQAAETMTNSIGIEFVRIPAGSFLMGTYCKDDPFTSQNECDSVPDDEEPQHRVRIAQDFYLGKYEVTQRQWHEIMDDNPAKFKTDIVGERSENHPVEQVSWNDVQTFIRRLNEREGCNNCYRLPTEAEWEYAARAGSGGKWSFGDDESQLGQYAWYDKNSGSKTHAAGQKRPNAFGLYDMHGNVWEWTCSDYAAYSYNLHIKCSNSDKNKSLRGGAWYYDAVNTRSASRDDLAPDGRSYDIGFRLAR